jgi:2-desacetyl-2-hydroxyethyl bacteriochlorophyllide A dehydrogenase
VSAVLESHAVVAGEDGVVRGVAVPLRSPADDEVLVRTLVSGVSPGTERWVTTGRFEGFGLPAVPGYQRIGEVVAMGAGVTGLEVGQVVVTTRCRGFEGPAAVWGAHSSLALSAAADVYDAEGIPADRAALFLTSQVGYHAASRLRIEAGEPVAVIGDGLIGASGAMAARLRGAEVTVLGRRPERRAALAGLGFGVGTVDEATEDGFVAVIDTAQNAESFATALRILRRGGQLVYSGHTPADAPAFVDIRAMQGRQLTVDLVSGWSSERVREVLDLMRRGELRPDEIPMVRARGVVEAAAVMQAVRDGILREITAQFDWRGTR